MLNEIKLVGYIGEAVSSQVVKAQLARMDQTQPLYVHIDSDGGSVTEGFRLYDAFQAYPGPKKAIIEPTAFSIASYIATAFDEVEIVENGYVMIHRPMLDVAGANADELASNSEMVAKMDETLVAAYSRKTGMSPEVVRDLMAKETYLNAQDAVKFGFASSIVSRSVPKLQVSNRLPHIVYAALRCVDGGDEKRETTGEKTMSNTPVAATIEEIEAAFPKLKAETVLACVKKKMPIASVAQAAVEEMMAENQMLKTECEALKAELASKASTVVIPGEEEEEGMCEATAKAKPGVKAVANVSTSTAKSALDQWNGLVADAKRQGMSAAKALVAVNRSNPGLRARMLAEVNAQ